MTTSPRPGIVGHLVRKSKDLVKSYDDSDSRFIVFHFHVLLAYHSGCVLQL